MSVSCTGVWGRAWWLLWPIASAGCIEQIEADEGERELSPPPQAVFEPAEGQVPFPTNLLLHPQTGRVALPATCGEEEGSSQAVLRSSINQLDGFATLGAAVQIPFSEPIDLGSAEGRVLLVRVAERGQPLPEPEPPVPLRLQARSRPILDGNCEPVAEAFELVAIPELPLLEASTYGVFLFEGVLTEGGEPIQPSATWSLIRQEDPPAEVAVDASSGEEVVVAHLTPFDPSDPEEHAIVVGLERLWRAHSSLLSRLDELPSTPLVAVERSGLLVASAFTTQTISAPFDPEVTGSPVSQFTGPSLSMVSPVAGGGALLSVEQLYASVLPEASCEALGCAAIGSIHGSFGAGTAPALSSLSFQQGEDCVLGSSSFGGAWADPLTPESVCQQSLPLLVVVPRAPAGPSGYPTVVFAHELGRSKEDLLAIAGSLAASGIASVGLDAVHHGARAVQVTSDAELGCAGAGPGLPCEQALSPTCAPQCYAPLLSGNLAVTRDNLRQSVLDQLQLEQALRSCSTAGQCGPLHVDAERIGLLGQSLGALIGAVTLPVSNMSAGVLHVGGGSWVDVLARTQTPGIRCPFVDGLIGAGVLEGQPWGLARDPSALCLGDTWLSDPGFVQFAQAARWLLAPADGLSFAGIYRRSDKAVLLAQVEDDRVVPNATTEALGALWGLSPTDVGAVTAVGEPTPEALLPGGQFLIYSDQPADAESGFVGNAYSHSSLLAPAAPSGGMAAGAGELATSRMQADVVSFFVSHWGDAR